MLVALVSPRSTPTNDELLRVACSQGWERLSPEEALGNLRSGDVAIGRLDVLPTLDGIDDGLWTLSALEARGVRVLNDAPALLAMHDKLLTARLLRRADVPHPRTIHVRPRRPFPALRPPVVVKPRYGSWGRDVVRCDDEATLLSTLERLSGRPWFERHGALVQELIPPQSYDLRVLVAAGDVVGAVFRVAAEGEWRTNIALGGVRQPVRDVPSDAFELAQKAAGVVGAALVGVDLLPRAGGWGWTVLEVNGAVEFTGEYSLGDDVYEAAAARLEHLIAACAEADRPVAAPAA